MNASLICRLPLPSWPCTCMRVCACECALCITEATSGVTQLLHVTCGCLQGASGRRDGARGGRFLTPREAREGSGVIVSSDPVRARRLAAAQLVRTAPPPSLRDAFISNMAVLSCSGTAAELQNYSSHPHGGGGRHPGGDGKVTTSPRGGAASPDSSRGARAQTALAPVTHRQTFWWR